MTIITEDMRLPAGATPNPVDVRVFLAGGGGRPVRGKVISTGEVIFGEERLSIGNGITAAGVWQLDLPGNADISPPGTTWFIRQQVGCSVDEMYANVPVTGGPFAAFDLEDDPLGTITPSALSAHAGDVTLHGGGVIVDIKTVTTSGVVTGSGGALFGAEVPGTTIIVPDVARPVKLFAHIPAQQQSGGPAEQGWMIMPQGIGGGIFNSIDTVNPAGLTTTNVRTVDVFGVLPAHSQGPYCIVATGQTGNLTAKWAASTLQRMTIRAELG